MGPIDYTIDVQTPFQAALNGYQVGAAIRNDQQQQAALQVQAQQQEALRQAYAATAAAPTADNVMKLMLLDPKSSESLKRAWDVKNTQQQQSQAADLLQWGAAIKTGKPQIAADQMLRRADLIEQENGGTATRESQSLRTQARLVAEHPEYALGQFQAILSANPNGKDAAETLAKFGTEQRAADQAPGVLRKVNADADAAESGAKTAAVAAKFAEPQIIADLKLKGLQGENILSEIGYRKEANRIAAMNAAANRESNDLKRQELRLKIQETETKLADAAREKVAAVESAASSIDNLLNTADRFLKVGVDANGKPSSTLRAAAGPLDSRLPTMQSDVADLEALAETLGSQAFLSQLPAMKGLGALSEKEGDKLQSALTNLSLKQSPEQLVVNVKEAQRLMLKARKNVEARYGVKAGVPDTPAVQTPAGDIDALVKKYGG